jgi:filamentous hemagglutinin
VGVAPAAPVSRIEDLYGQSFPAIPLSHLPGRQNGDLGEQLALQLLNERTGLNFRPLQNASNHGCDGCAVSIQGNTITVVVADAKSSQNGVNAAANAAGDPAVRLDGWLNQEWAGSSANRELRDELRAALGRGAAVQGITIKVGLPAPGTTGAATFRIEPWPRKQ